MVSMNIPFLDLKAQYQSIRDEVNPAIQQVLDNTAYVLGKSVSDFETAFAQAHQVKHCIGVSSGTDGNHLALWVLGIQAGDEVIIPANTFIATAWGATLCGATPVFVDCEQDSYNLDPSKIEVAITAKTKAIVAVHLYGQPANMDKISEALLVIGYELKDKGIYVHSKTGQKIYLVEDCAQAHLAEYLTREICNIENSIKSMGKGKDDNTRGVVESQEHTNLTGKWKRVGGFGITSSFSFYPGKNLGAYGEAGAFTTNDEFLAKKAKMFRDHGTLQKYNHETFGHNYRMEGIQGAVLGVKLNHLPVWTEKRRAVAAKYKALLNNVGDIVLPKEMPYAKHVYHLFVIQTIKRDELQKYLTTEDIGTGLHYPIPLHLQKCFSTLGHRREMFPVSEQLADRCLSLPMFAEMTDSQIEYVCDCVKKFF
jgi:dTDP-4-amino-4,6-dideoxygalactose transaminase